MKFLICACSLILVYLSSIAAEAREWTDKTGLYKVNGDLVAFDEKEIIIKLDKKERGRELLAFPIDQLSDVDITYLQSEEHRLSMEQNDKKQTWTLKNGITVIGKPVDFAKRDVVVQRRRGKVFVNDRLLTTLPEVYQRMIPKIVEYFDKRPIPDDKAFNDWMKEQKANARSFPCEGVILEFPNGEEYAFPFFFFSDSDRAMFEPNWEKWVADSEKVEEQRQHSLYMQSQAVALKQSQQNQANMARLQLQLQAVTAGVTDAWEVHLNPGPGVRGYPLNVVVTARNSNDASIIAMRNNPGYVVGPIRRLNRF